MMSEIRAAIAVSSARCRACERREDVLRPQEQDGREDQRPRERGRVAVGSAAPTSGLAEVVRQSGAGEGGRTGRGRPPWPTAVATLNGAIDASARSPPDLASAPQRGEAGDGGEVHHHERERDAREPLARLEHRAGDGEAVEHALAGEDQEDRGRCRARGPGSRRTGRAAPTARPAARSCARRTGARPGLTKGTSSRGSCARIW